MAAYSAMASGGTLLLCALLSLSTAHTACLNPPISKSSCKRNSTAAGLEAPQWCGGHLFRCNNASAEIQFGGSEPWFKVVGGDEANVLEIEDTYLTFIFGYRSCSFFCNFTQPGPLFSYLPSNTLRSSNSVPIISTHCDKAVNSFISTKVDGPCADYVLYYTSGEGNLQGTAITSGLCPPATIHPRVIWRLWMTNPDAHGNISFNIISVGFWPPHGQHPHCFKCEMKAGQCDPDTEGHPTCGTPHKNKSNLAAGTNNFAAGKGHQNKWTAPPIGAPHKNKSNSAAGSNNSDAGKGHQKIWRAPPTGEHNRHHHVSTGVIVGVSTATGLSILASFLLYLWCRNSNPKESSPSSTLLSPAASPDTFMTSHDYPTHVFSYEELHEATNGFSRPNELDHGGHAAVYRGTLVDGRTVAVKRLYENSFKCAELFVNEIAILSRLHHPNLVTLYGCTSRHSRELLLVYEFVPNGTIADHLHGHRAAEGALVWPLRLRIAVETATALAYLHATQPQIIHRDVKTKNILLDRDFHVKVADFGLSRLFPVAATYVSTVPQGTPGYVDPEYHRCYQLTDKSDVYSFGVVLAELMSSKPAVDVTRHLHEINLSTMALNKIQNAALEELVDPKLGFETNSEVKRSIQLVAELTMRCLQEDREMRPTMEDALEVLRGIEDGIQKAEGGDIKHMGGEDMVLQKNNAPKSPDSVIGTWPSRMTTPNDSA